MDGEEEVLYKGEWIRRREKSDSAKVDPESEDYSSGH